MRSKSTARSHALLGMVCDFGLLHIVIIVLSLLLALSLMGCATTSTKGNLQWELTGTKADQ